jgi:hemerythrin-like metal-binding protein
MPIVRWHESYSLGIEPIDSHHEHLVDLLNNTYDSLVEHEVGEKIDIIFDELIAYSKYHFAAEEHLMDTSAYPKMDEHVRQHDAFSKKIDRFQKQFHDGNALITVGVLAYLKDWLIDHILYLDAEFVRFKSTLAINSSTI